MPSGRKLTTNYTMPSFEVFPLTRQRIDRTKSTGRMSAIFVLPFHSRDRAVMVFHSCPIGGAYLVSERPVCDVIRLFDTGREDGGHSRISERCFLFRRADMLTVVTARATENKALV